MLILLVTFFKLSLAASVSLLKPTLLCTVNHFTNRSVVAPDDGLCDFTFYDSFFKDETYDLAAPYKDSFNHFLELAAHHVKTQSRDPINKALSENPSKVKADLINLSHRNISHFGCVDIGHVYFGTHNLKRVLSILKRVYDMLKDERVSQHPMYTILTVPMYLPDDGVWLRQLSDALKHSGHTLDGLIAVAHLSENDFNAGYACRIVPPMFLNAPNIPDNYHKINPYKYSMSLEYAALLKFASKWKPSSTLFVSVPLHGKWYTYDDDYAFDTLCGVDEPPSLYGSVVEVCKNSEYNTTYVMVPHTGVMSACEKLQRVFTYDDSKSYRYKLCTLKKNLTSLQYGILALGIDLDDTTNRCGQGSYDRLRTLRWLVDFFKNSFTSPDAYDQCQQGP
ncbi:hypothetical protein HPB49_011406 [Dermacentor silvarum]|uniref:Uncharacterized protein n=1 Tax=Dermacentor silvarum TaxID=543639 RepID=A0ACB8CKN9_DERSI|nr:hypothetical protein HPB49_011406 [Dermacentor silvarum]